MAKNQTHIEQPSTNGHAPVPLQDIPAEQQQAILQAHRGHKKEVQEQSDEQTDKGRLDTFLNLFGTPLDGIPRPVKCTIAGFEHWTVYYNTSRPTRKRREYPTLVPQATGEDDATYFARYDEWVEAMGKWIALFVVRIEALDEVGTPHPLPIDSPGFYTAIFEHNEPLAIWVAFTGYSLSLEQAVGNSDAA